MSAEEVAAAVDRTEGVTASFVKELLRRAVLESLTEADDPLQRVTGRHLERALDDLLDSTQSVTRALLGVPADQRGPVEAPPPGGRGYGGHRGMDWAVPSPTAYASYLDLGRDDH